MKIFIVVVFIVRKPVCADYFSIKDDIKSAWNRNRSLIQGHSKVKVIFIYIRLKNPRLINKTVIKVGVSIRKA